eukprot:CAMPEP_0119307374 /NCGR_PEP_ID=MMETSP1333-20130426/7899_1 /TAXON_ID=418940 /ORGANISM="Scyphosphaera apsteinii, Strain RCC1455" /LENGTH=539 /DNA_ID=CAMNT_0007310913 /DNA_START=38 /DNA_END=1657 /DNA_ORIENTATION=+
MEPTKMNRCRRTPELARYELGRQLGAGSFGIVLQAEHKAAPRFQVAIKVVDKAQAVMDVNEIHREIGLLRMLAHPNVIGLHEVFEDTLSLYLVLELCSGGDLFDRVVSHGPFAEPSAAKAMGELCSALKHIHSFGIVHRDIKPENLLLVSDAPDAPIKLADFGQAYMPEKMASSASQWSEFNRTQHGRSHDKAGKQRWQRAFQCMKAVETTQRASAVTVKMMGTPQYAPPELFADSPQLHTGAIDMWSAGVVLYVILCGFPPFHDNDLPFLIDMISNCRFSFPSPWWDDVKAAPRELIEKLLRPSAAQRLTPEQVLQDGWVVRGGWPPDEEVLIELNVFISEVVQLVEDQVGLEERAATTISRVFRRGAELRKADAARQHLASCVISAWLRGTVVRSKLRDEARITAAAYIAAVARGRSTRRDIARGQAPCAAVQVAQERTSDAQLQWRHATLIVKIVTQFRAVRRRLAATKRAALVISQSRSRSRSMSPVSTPANANAVDGTVERPTEDAQLGLQGLRGTPKAPRWLFRSPSSSSLEP